MDAQRNTWLSSLQTMVLCHLGGDGDGEPRGRLYPQALLGPSRGCGSSCSWLSFYRVGNHRRKYDASTIQRVRCVLDK